MPDRSPRGRGLSPAFLPYGRQEIGDADIKAVVEALVSGWLTTGPRVAQFEQAFARHCAAAEGVAVNSGTAALHCAMRAVGVGPGDEVIVPAITFAASANAAIYEGATPVFADVEPDTLLIDPASVKRHRSPPAPKRSSRSIMAASPPTMTRCMPWPASAASASSPMPATRRARPIRAGTPARWRIFPVSPSIRSSISPPAKAACA